MRFIDTLAEQVPDWPRDTLANDFAQAIKGAVQMKPCGRPAQRLDSAWVPLPPLIKPKKRKHRGFPTEVRTLLNARNAA